MKPILDLIGARFGKRVVVRRAMPANSKGGAARWIVRCDCGREDAVEGKMLKSGKGLSCNECKSRRHGHTKHGRSGNSQAYRSWKAMRARIGKGAYKQVTCCERWAVFENFLDDMGDAEDGMTIDRIDPWKGYEPGNCRWAPLAEQSGSRKSAVKTRERVSQIRRMLDSGVPKAVIAQQCGVKYDAVSYIAKKPNAWASL